MSLSPALPPSVSFENLLHRVTGGIYSVIEDFEIVAWVTREPVPFSQRTSGVEKKLGVGDRWGEQLFDCAWFRFRARVPNFAHESAAALVARIDVNGEACVVDAQGTPVRGLTCVHSVFDRSLGTPAKTIFQISPEFIQDGICELWADAGLNDLFGSVPRHGQVEFAQLCVCREDVRALHYDLEVINELHGLLSSNDPLAGEISATLTAVDLLLSDLTPESVRHARQKLEPLLRRRSNSTSLHVSAIGHAHLDLAWLWPIRETIRKGARTFATALYNIERYPDYIFGMSQPQLFAWIQAHYPVLYGKVKAAVRGSRIELLGSMWVEPDCNLPSGESLVRQILHGARYFLEEFGYNPRFCWQPDVFGYNAQLPQILKKTGHDFFMTQKLSWNLVNKFPHHSFVWEGIDGSTILAHMLPEDTYNGPAAPRSLAKIAQNYAQRDVSHHALMVYGIGDGGGGPDAEHLERLRRECSLADLPDVRLERAGDFFTAWAKDAAKFPRWRGELYLERHQGTFTTQALAKKYNRQAEILLREVELAVVLCTEFATTPNLARRLDEIWKEILLYQFHDILPGSSIKRVYDEAYPRYRILLSELEKMAVDLWTDFASHISSPTDHIIFNSLPWTRSEWLKLAGQWHHVNVPAVGWAALNQTAREFIPLSMLSVTDSELENDLLHVRLNATGGIVSLQRKDSGHEFVAPGETLNVFIAYADTGDAWDFPSDYRAAPSQAPALISAKTFRDGPRVGIVQVSRLGSSTIRQQITLCAGSSHLEFETEVDWHEPATMLRVRFPAAVESETARFEIPFGSVQRPTHERTSWEKAQIEVPAQQWVDLAEPSHGVALLNDCKYGFRIKGNIIEMNLIRSVPHPGTPLINKDDRSDSARATHYTDQGHHSFRYALWPHHGYVEEGRLTEAARRFNVPLRSIQCSGNSEPTLPNRGSAIWIESNSIDLSAVKIAEDGVGCVLRFANVENRHLATSVNTRFPFARAFACDLCEKNEQPLNLTADGSFNLEFGPFEVKTVRLCP